MCICADYTCTSERITWLLSNDCSVCKIGIYTKLSSLVTHFHLLPDPFQTCSCPNCMVTGS